ncbi:hypothetical protein [Iamia sp.]|uniref:hypothetical protein n=1 Tax=Iamia sp. TaxID=2722710 RepID=UPI002CA770DB|nr:hypothetical protein [Iamia sp.]HXH58815.1 hypothetical protein [Iamia sp.]
MSTNGYWAVSLVLGLVVCLVAVALLEVFYRHVRRIERGADAVWVTGQAVARNTATTWMLGQTSTRLGLLTEEALRHDELLRGATGREVS